MHVIYGQYRQLRRCATVYSILAAGEVFLQVIFLEEKEKGIYLSIYLSRSARLFSFVRSSWTETKVAEKID